MTAPRRLTDAEADAIERAWIRELQLRALMGAPGAVDLDADLLQLGERVRPDGPPGCIDCGADGVVSHGRCGRCRSRWERANPEAVAAAVTARGEARTARRAEAHRLRAEGRSLTEIARALGVHRATIVADLKHPPAEAGP